MRLGSDFEPAKAAVVSAVAFAVAFVVPSIVRELLSPSRACASDGTDGPKAFLKWGSFFFCCFLALTSGCFRYVPESEERLGEHGKRISAELLADQTLADAQKQRVAQLASIFDVLDQRLLALPPNTVVAPEAFQQDLLEANGVERKIDSTKNFLWALVDATASTLGTAPGAAGGVGSLMAIGLWLLKRKKDSAVEAQKRIGDYYREKVPEAARDTLDEMLPIVAKKFDFDVSHVKEWMQWQKTPDAS